jgi:hypothetical protein
MLSEYFFHLEIPQLLQDFDPVTNDRLFHSGKDLQHWSSLTHSARINKNFYHSYKHPEDKLVDNTSV